jgi:Arc/MetJ family transcription regulator
MHRTNIELDEKLVGEAMKLTRMRTKKEVVNYALKELVRKKRRKKLLEFEGRVSWTGKLDEMRRARA